MTYLNQHNSRASSAFRCVDSMLPRALNTLFSLSICACLNRGDFFSNNMSRFAACSLQARSLYARVVQFQFQFQGSHTQHAMHSHNALTLYTHARRLCFTNTRVIARASYNTFGLKHWFSHGPCFELNNIRNNLWNERKGGGLWVLKFVVEGGGYWTCTRFSAQRCGLSFGSTECWTKTGARVCGCRVLLNTRFGTNKPIYAYTLSGCWYIDKMFFCAYFNN